MGPYSCSHIYYSRYSVHPHFPFPYFFSFANCSDDPAYTTDRIVSALMAPKLDASDATDEWWTGAFSSDKTEDVRRLLL